MVRFGKNRPGRRNTAGTTPRSGHSPPVRHWLRKVSIASLATAAALVVSIFTLAQFLGWWQQPGFDHTRLQRDFTTIQAQIRALHRTRIRVQDQITGVKNHRIIPRDAAREIAAIDALREQIVHALSLPQRHGGNAERYASRLASIANLEKRTGEAYRACFLRNRRACPSGNRLRDQQDAVKTNFVTGYNDYVQRTAALAKIAIATIVASDL